MTGLFFKEKLTLKLKVNNIRSLRESPFTVKANASQTRLCGNRLTFIYTKNLINSLLGPRANLCMKLSLTRIQTLKVVGPVNNCYYSDGSVIVDY